MSLLSQFYNCGESSSSGVGADLFGGQPFLNFRAYKTAFTAVTIPGASTVDTSTGVALIPSSTNPYGTIGDWTGNTGFFATGPTILDWHGLVMHSQFNCDDVEEIYGNVNWAGNGVNAGTFNTPSLQSVYGDMNLGSMVANNPKICSIDLTSIQTITGEVRFNEIANAGTRFLFGPTASNEAISKVIAGLSSLKRPRTGTINVMNSPFTIGQLSADAQTAWANVGALGYTLSGL